MLGTQSAVRDEQTTSADNKCNVDESELQRQREGQQAGETCYDLSRFRTVRVLNNNSTHKSVCLLGHFTNLSTEQYAIVVLEKRAFTEAQVTTAATSSSHTFFTSSSRLETEFINDIYGNFVCTVDPALNRLKVTIVYPAAEKHIVKYSVQKRFFIEETADLYKRITLPHLEQGQLSLEWLYNVLEHRKEKERIVYEDPCNENGFILLPDLKWDGKTVEQLYLLALVRRRDIRSLRDLTSSHLPLLRNVQSRGIAAIKERYGIGPSELRIFLHYQPTFYHLHMHFTYLRHDPPGITCEKAHLLSTVISNIELLPDYYQRVTLSYALKETDKLYEKFVAALAQLPSEPAAKRAKVDTSAEPPSDEAN
ncbi:m7GpppX diphosphatase [Anopheles ziemanni]|uniref:m7GpppX diphosphatase n=1 Tax=Anopheles ziemanni TaxID=345580 RepID=UPI002658AE5D|nr:m7GpppX diphosphatase isoform X2 [Anopheles coustani]XP_058170834.1 m7GpppX diphosphatase [Anopheles ziemanni]